MADTISTSATIDYTDQGGNKGQKSLTDINPNATNQQIRALAVAMNGLTTNTLTGVNKIVKTEISSVAKTETTITLNATSGNTDILSADTLLNARYTPISYDCNNRTGFVVVTYNDTVFPVLAVRDTTNDTDSIIIGVGSFSDNIVNAFTNPSNNYYVNGDTSKHLSKTGTIKFYVEETDTHTRSAEMTITINA